MINRVVLVGRMTKDCELRYTGSNIAVATFNLAVNRNYTNSDGNNEADFIQCVVWRQTAENLSRYTRKGSLVGVDGRIQTRNYEANDGSRRHITEVVCDNVRYLDSKNSITNQDVQQNSNNEQMTITPQYEHTNINIKDDDLPF